MQFKILSFQILLLFICLTKVSAKSVSIDEPEKVFPLTEIRSWTELEPLRNFDVLCVDEDSTGHLWFAIAQGLIRYDGYNCEIIHYPEFIQGAIAVDILVSQNDTIHIHTTNGFHSYKDGRWKTLSNFQAIDTFVRRLIQESQTGIIFTLIKGKLFRVHAGDLIPIDLGNKYLSAISKTNSALWITAENEVLKIPLKNGDISEEIDSKGYDISDYPRFLKDFSLITSPSGRVCIQNTHKAEDTLELNPQADRFEPTPLNSQFGRITASEGIYAGSQEILILNGKTATFARIKNKWKQLDIDAFMPTSNSFIFERENGNLIVGGKGETVYEIDFSQTRWKTLQNLHFQCEGVNESLWFLSLSGEIIEKKTSSEEWYVHQVNMIDTPVSIMCSDDGCLWVSGAHENVAAVSFFDGEKWQLHKHPKLQSGISYLSSKQLKNGDVLFGSGEEGGSDKGGLVIYRKISGKYQFHYKMPPGVPSRIVGIAEGKQDLWFGGVSLARSEAGRPLHVIDVAETNHVWTDAILDDSMGNIWIGLWEGGVFRWSGDKWDVFNNRQQIASNNIASMVCDSARNKLWVATNRGISMYDFALDKWTPNATGAHILMKREGGTLDIDEDGNLWINNAARGWYFRNANDYVLSDKIRRDFKTIRYSPDEHPPQVTVTTSQARLSESSNISISWAGIDYQSITKQESLLYSYRIDDSAWTSYHPQTYIVLSDLEPGHHALEVKCRDSDGNVSLSPTQVSFEVTPLMWKQPWFILVVTMLIILIVTLSVLLIRQRIKNLIQLEEFKIQFFTNISHELRTPLTLILGPIESQLKALTGPARRPMELAQKNTHKMLHLVDQILDFRKMQMGKPDEHYVHGNVIECINETIALLDALVKEKSLELVISFSQQDEPLWYDASKIEKIVDNLLLNAIKYTPASGRVLIQGSIQESSSAKRKLLEIVIEDNGIGIPENKMKHIFEPFYRVKESQNAGIRGTGLGLALVKTLVDSAQGSLSVQSPINKRNADESGTRFVVQFPVYTEIDHLDVSEDAPEQNSSIQDITLSPSKKLSSHSPETDQTILIVEDDQDILEYLSIELGTSYKILTATNGEIGIQIAKNDIPDLIITDVMMPVMDGRKLVEQLKHSLETSHIPIIMLTALSSKSHELQGLEKGADDYISKPIHLDILKTRIRNQLQLKELLRQKYRSQKSDASIDYPSITENTADQNFLKQLEQILMDSIQDPFFDIQQLSEKMHMSRVTLYRKLKAITGESPSAFVKTIRMNQAASHLKSGHLSIAEISDAIGMSDPSYFSASFKSHFKCSPKQFQRKWKDDTQKMD